MCYNYFPRHAANFFQNLDRISKIPVKIPVKLVFWPGPGFGKKSNPGY